MDEVLDIDGVWGYVKSVGNVEVGTRGGGGYCNLYQLCVDICRV